MTTTLILLCLFAIPFFALCAFVKWNPGSVGEWLLHALLKLRLDKSRFRVLRDVMLPTDDEATTQIDHIVVCAGGIFVIETKTYGNNGTQKRPGSCWIFGNAADREWTASYPRGRKFRFQNPIRQNFKHVATLADRLGIPREICQSVIAFAGMAKFKTEMPPEVMHIVDVPGYILSHESDDRIKPEQIPEVADVILSWQATLTRERRAAHVENLRRVEERRRIHDAEIRLRDRFAEPFRSLLEEDRYIANGEWRRLSESGRALAEAVRDKSRVLPGSADDLRLALDPEGEVSRHNRDFTEREKARCAEFFRTVADHPLDGQQMDCCIVDEDAGLVVAGAGSGKTSVIAAKVAYLVEVRHVPPEKILLVSFTNKAADEMTDRVSRYLGVRAVEASTFHKFGLGVIKRFNPGPFDIAEDGFLKKLIHGMMTGSEDFAPETYESVVDFLAYYFNSDDKEDGDYATLADKIEHEKRFDLETLKSIAATDAGNVTLAGETVKSAEELAIANFLFLNGIEYEYERKYDKPHADDGRHRAYRPDFHLPESDVYLEHYGLDENGEPPPFFSAVEKRKYKESMEWKRKLHAAAGNKYVETFSWWFRKGVIFENLSRELSGLGVAFRPRDRREVFRLVREKAANRLDGFENLLATFITLFKSNGFGASKFDEFSAIQAKTAQATLRRRCFLRLAKAVYERYERKLSEERAFDFNDMINKAALIVEGLPSGALGYAYVIVDEYQDVSVSRIRLLKAILGNTGAHLFCVGDDWQSIFRFAGSDVSLFTRFGEHFAHAAEMRIENTYRNSQELLDAMGRFVTMNPAQLPKKLKSAKHCDDPIVPISYNGKEDKPRALREAARSIYRETGGRAATVLLLGRTKYDETTVKDSSLFVRKDGAYAIPQAPELSFRFLTVHKSKGLEGDYAILLNAEDGQLGFPNRIADDPLLQLVLGAPEPYEFAEERRLFYVALTRTRNRVFILVPDKARSPFIDDLQKCGVSNLEPPEAAEKKIQCPKCKKGTLEKREGPHGPFSGCSNYPHCDYVVPVPVDETTPRCPECGGFLVERLSKHSGNPFLGCTNYPLCRHIEQLSIPSETCNFGQPPPREGLN